MIDWILPDLWRRSQNLLDWVGFRTWGWVRPVRICSDWLNSCWFVKVQSESSWLGWASYLRFGWASQNVLWLIEVLLICKGAVRIFLIGLGFVPEVRFGQSESALIDWSLADLWMRTQNLRILDWVGLRTWGWVRPVRIFLIGLGFVPEVGRPVRIYLWLIEFFLICEGAVRIFLIGSGFVPEVGLGQSESALIQIDWILADLWRRSQNLLDWVVLRTWG